MKTNEQRNPPSLSFAFFISFLPFVFCVPLIEQCDFMDKVIGAGIKKMITSIVNTTQIYASIWRKICQNLLSHFSISHIQLVNAFTQNSLSEEEH